MPQNNIEYYMQYIESLGDGIGFDVTSKEADFLEDLMVRKPKFLSPKQIQWIKDMTSRYLHEDID